MLESVGSNLYISGLGLGFKLDITVLLAFRFMLEVILEVWVGEPALAGITRLRVESRDMDLTVPSSFTS